MIAMYLLLFVFTAFHNPYIMGTDGMNYISFFIIFQQIYLKYLILNIDMRLDMSFIM